MNKTKNRPGVAIMAVVIFVTVIGLAGAVFFLANRRSETRETTYNIQRKLATNCMESGVQIALQCIQDETFEAHTPTPLAQCSPNTEWTYLEDNPQSCEYDYSLEEIRQELTFTLLKKDQTDLVIVQPNTAGAGNPANGTTDLQIQWNTDTGNVLELNSYKPDRGTGYDLTQTDYLCSVPGSPTNPPAGSPESGKTFVVAADLGNNTCEVTVPIPTNEEFMQVTSRYGDARNISVRLIGPNPPLQGYKIESKGKAGDVELTAEVSFFINEEYGVARMINNSIIINGIL